MCMIHWYAAPMNITVCGVSSCYFEVENQMQRKIFKNKNVTKIVPRTVFHLISLSNTYDYRFGFLTQHKAVKNRCVRCICWSFQLNKCTFILKKLIKFGNSSQTTMNYLEFLNIFA